MTKSIRFLFVLALLFLLQTCKPSSNSNNPQCDSDSLALSTIPEKFKNGDTVYLKFRNCKGKEVVDKLEISGSQGIVFLSDEALNGSGFHFGFQFHHSLDSNGFPMFLKVRDYRFLEDTLNSRTQSLLWEIVLDDSLFSRLDTSKVEKRMDNYRNQLKTE